MTTVRSTQIGHTSSLSSLARFISTMSSGKASDIECLTASFTLASLTESTPIDNVDVDNKRRVMTESMRAEVLTVKTDAAPVFPSTSCNNQSEYCFVNNYKKYQQTEFCLFLAGWCITQKKSFCDGLPRMETR